MNREEAIDIIENKINIDVRFVTDEECDLMVEALELAIEALSQPERPKGRWEEHNGILICSECGAGVNGSKSINHFCPNCGADMRISGEQDV